MFLIFQVLTKSWPGDMVVLSGTFTSTVAKSHEYLSHKTTTVPSALVTCATGSDVWVAVASGLPGACVSVGVAGTTVNTAAVNVNWETTVPAADVRTAATSGVD